jgi:hypothetical protein
MVGREHPEAHVLDEVPEFFSFVVVSHGELLWSQRDMRWSARSGKGRSPETAKRDFLSPLPRALFSSCGLCLHEARKKDEEPRNKRNRT